MTEPRALYKDVLFVGLTRVPTVLGVPYAAFVFEVMVLALLNVGSGNPLLLLSGIPLHGLLYLVSAHDPGIFAEVYVWTKTIGRCRNKKFWGGSSFSPLETRKWQRPV